MNQEVACPAPIAEMSLGFDSIPFPEIPGTSTLFARYQTDPLSLRSFYPSVVPSHTEVAARIPEVLAGHAADRSVLCDALEDTNRRLGAGEETLRNISLLREADTVAVVSGQQAGLFSGPLYTIYKALSAVRMAECLRGRGFNAVPVFWIATEDHDFEEVSKTYVVDASGHLAELRNEPKRCHENLPVGWVKLDETIEDTIDELIKALVPTEHTAKVRELLESSWTSKEYYGDAFGKMLTAILGKYGLIMLCPLESRLKALAAPVYIEAIRRRDEIVEALRSRSETLSREGYNAQVFIGEDYFPLFWQSRDGTRLALKKDPDGRIHTKDGSEVFTSEELLELAEREPTHFSPSVVLRSVVQDYLLPTACYFGGAAEVAYFGQSSEVYRVLDRPQTPILHRQSFTFVESRHAKSMRKFGLSLTDLFAGIEAVFSDVVDEHLAAGTAMLIAEVEERINAELNRLDREFARLDPTLADNLATRRRKILYHIGAMRTRFHHSQFRRNETARRQVESLFASLLPHQHLQERSINLVHFLNRFGMSFVDWIYGSIDLDDKGHRVVYL